MPETGMAAAKAEVLSLQARLEQIEAYIESAHTHVDKMLPRAGIEPGAEPSASAQDTASRCQRKLEELNQRLINVTELVGAL